MSQQKNYKESTNIISYKLNRVLLYAYDMWHMYINIFNMITSEMFIMVICQ